ncbi:MAG: VanZ family protein [Clostridium sp.]|nr:VanZ family protein [Clostridium sp.]
MKKVISIMLCVLWMGFIFYNSSQSGTASNNFTNKIVDKIINVSEKVQEKGTDNVKVYASPESSNNSNVSLKSLSSDTLVGSIKSSIKTKDKTALNVELRKIGHALEFLVLAVLLCNVFFTFGFQGSRAIIYILFIVLFYAVTDEFHQIYVVGRGSSVRDVLIDFFGGILGLIGYYVTYYSVKKIRKTK